MASIHLQVDNLTKSFGDRMIFADVSFVLCEGDKVGLIAKNGTGKSTLLNVLTGREPEDSGTARFAPDLRVGYLEQCPTLPSGLSVIEAALAGITDWEREQLTRKLLDQLGITDLDAPTLSLSGGQAKRVALARLLAAEPQLLLLDEPTNHLDIDVIEWLERYLSRSRITLLMVTHDRYFLDAVTNKIFELADCRLYSYDGNYNRYLELRAQRLEAQNARRERAANLLRRELDWMRRQPQARATKAKYRIDAFYDLREQARPQYDDGKLQLRVKSGYIGNKIFEARHVSKRFGSKVILDDFNYIFARYEKLGIVGHNGVGKSTLIKIIQGIVAPDSGTVDVGTTVRFGYFGQESIALDSRQRVIDIAREIAEVVHFDEKTSYTAAQFLNHFLFSPPDQQKYVAKLSGGELRRLQLATVLMRKPNFLILDEPTNDLDIVTLEILEEYVTEFKGCVIVVSHDRFFMDRCVDHIFVMEGEGTVKDFPGNYSEYRAWRAAHASKPDAEEPKREQYKPRHAERNRLTFKEKREYEALTAEISALDEERRQLEAVFNGTATAMPDGSAIDFDAASRRYAEVKELLDAKELRWLELSEKEP